MTINLDKLVDHIDFNDIFEACKNEDGKTDWLKVAHYENLPTHLIDKYFAKLRPLGIEKNQILNEFIITKYKNSLNWYILVKYQNLSESTLTACVDKIDKLKLWPYIIKHQLLSENFLMNNLDKFKNIKSIKNSLVLNGKIPDETKNKIYFLLDI